MTFSQGEALFIEAARRCRNIADPTLKEQISHFIKQETLHTREHVAFNQLIAAAGYDTWAMEAYCRDTGVVSA